ncbi:MAG: hypothetical protein HYT29_02000 [Parcubacteria group bacterium]|nr:hypothetical protein [Parcubacteria group bacterium]
MSQCMWCGYYHGGHAAGCPSNFPANSPERNMYRAGRQDGRSGNAEAFPENSSYALGFRAGIVALEEAQNGFDPRFA